MSREYIYEVGEPVGGLRSFERTGEVVRCRECKWWDEKNLFFHAYSR